MPENRSSIPTFRALVSFVRFDFHKPQLVGQGGLREWSLTLPGVGTRHAVPSGCTSWRDTRIGAIFRQRSPSIRTSSRPRVPSIAVTIPTMPSCTDGQMMRTRVPTAMSSAILPLLADFTRSRSSLPRIDGTAGLRRATAAASASRRYEPGKKYLRQPGAARQHPNRQGQPTIRAVQSGTVPEGGGEAAWSRPDSTVSSRALTDSRAFDSRASKVGQDVTRREYTMTCIARISIGFTKSAAWVWLYGWSTKPRCTIDTRRTRHSPDTR